MLAQLPPLSIQRQSRDTDLFYCLCCKYNWVVISNTDAILDTNANASEVRGPPVVVGNINSTGREVSMGFEAGGNNYSRLYGDTLPGLQVVTPRVSTAVMDIQSDIVS
jgi:hypothetical protein